MQEGVEVCAFSGLLVNFVREKSSNVIVRGLRAVSDYEYEAQIAMANRRLDSEIETIFFVTSEEHSFISSSIVKDVANHGGDVSSMAPECVKVALSLK